MHYGAQSISQLTQTAVIQSLIEYRALVSSAHKKFAAHAMWVLSNIASNYSVFITIIYPSLASLMYRQQQHD